MIISKKNFPFLRKTLFLNIQHIWVFSCSNPSSWPAASGNHVGGSSVVYLLVLTSLPSTNHSSTLSTSPSPLSSPESFGLSRRWPALRWRSTTPATPDWWWERWPVHMQCPEGCRWATQEWVEGDLADCPVGDGGCLCRLALLPSLCSGMLYAI